MAAMLRSSTGVISQLQSVLKSSGRLACLEGLVSRRWVAAGSSEHTLAVRQQIQDTRMKGLDAGGPKRIESQHKKVQKCHFNLTPVYVSACIGCLQQLRSRVVS